MRRQMTLRPVSFVLIAAALLLILTAAAVERQISVQGLQPAHWAAAGIARAVEAPLAAGPAKTGDSATRKISAAPGRAPLAPAAAAPTISEPRLNPAAASRCPNKPGSERACTSP